MIFFPFQISYHAGQQIVFSEDDILPLSGKQEMIPLPIENAVHEISTPIDEHQLLFARGSITQQVVEGVLEMFVGKTTVEMVKRQITQLELLGMEVDEITNIIISDALPKNPLKHTRLARQVAELKEAGYKHLLKKHGLEALAKKKEAEIEQLMLNGKSFEFILTLVTEGTNHPFLHQ